MKKVLLATTALVVSAGVAQAAGHAEVSISVDGGADLGVVNNGSDTNAVATIDVSFAGSGETDGGLGFGFDYTLLSGAPTGAVGKDNWEVYISGTWGKLTVGDPDSALQSVAGIGDIGFKGIGVDNVAEFGRGLGDDAGVLYSNTFGSVSVYLSHGLNLDDDNFGAGVSFSAGGITIGLGYNDTTNAGVDGVTAVDLAGSFSGFGFDIYYEDHDLGNNYGTILSYDAGMTTVQLGWADGDNNPNDAAIGVGFAYDLGGGATLEGGVGEVADETVWDLGIEMTF